MIIDTKLCFTYAYSAGTYADFYQAVTNAGEEVSTNTIDLDAAGLMIAGGSKPPWLICKVGAAASGCASTEMKLITSTAPALNADVKVVKYFRFTQGQMTIGALLINEPLGHFKYQRYLGMEFTPFTNDSTLTVCAFLNDGPAPAVTDIAITEAGS